MADILEKNLKKLALMQKKYTKIFAFPVLIITVAFDIGLKDLSVSSDTRKEMLLELPIYMSMV